MKYQWSALVLILATNAYSEELKTSAYLDGYFSYNFERPQQSLAIPLGDGKGGIYTRAPGENQLRNFDVQDKQFTLALLELSVTKNEGPLSLILDLDFGEIADMTHLKNGKVDEGSKNIGQALIIYAPKAWQGYSLKLGKMATHLGWEVTKAKDNWQYSRSFLFALGIPYWHQGLSFGGPLWNENSSFSLFVNNGWNAAKDNNEDLTYGWQLGSKIGSSLALFYNGISGAEADQELKRKRQLHELILAYDLSEVLKFAFDGIYGTEERSLSEGSLERSKARWAAYEFSARYALTDSLALSPRIESFWDYEGFMSGKSQSLRALTLTAAYALDKGIEIRGEYRSDASTTASFESHEGPSKNQRTLSLSTLVSL